MPRRGTASVRPSREGARFPVRAQRGAPHPAGARPRCPESLGCRGGRADRSPGVDTALSRASPEKHGLRLVKLRATLRLAPLLDPKAPAWSNLERELRLLADLNFLQAELRLVDHLLDTGRPAEAVGRIEGQLRKAEDVASSLAYRVHLADLYRRTGRLLEARLMAAEGAEEMLDPYLRIELLRVLTEIARARVRAGEADASHDLAIYEAVFQEVRPR